jgi:hypothetical protein
MTNDDIAHLRLLADWHDRQARYLLLTVPAGQHDQGRFHSMAAARLSRLADEATMSRSGGEAQLTGFRGRAGKKPGQRQAAHPVSGVTMTSTCSPTASSSAGS